MQSRIRGPSLRFSTSVVRSASAWAIALHVSQDESEPCLGHRLTTSWIPLAADVLAPLVSSCHPPSERLHVGRDCRCGCERLVERRMPDTREMRPTAFQHLDPELDVNGTWRTSAPPERRGVAGVHGLLDARSGDDARDRRARTRGIPSRALPEPTSPVTTDAEPASLEESVGPSGDVRASW